MNVTCYYTLSRLELINILSVYKNWKLNSKFNWNSPKMYWYNDFSKKKNIAVLTIGYTQCMTSHMTQFSLIKTYSNVYVRVFFSWFVFHSVVICAHDPEQNENSNKISWKKRIPQSLFWKKYLFCFNQVIYGFALKSKYTILKKKTW